jgi:class 3 adenylate cyclase
VPLIHVTRYTPITYTGDQKQAWFSRYLTPPLRELLDRGPAAKRSLDEPREAYACILFTDIRGFTELSRTIRPNALFGALDRQVGPQSELVDYYGGYVDNFTGDGVMAVFEGDGIEDNACRCAIEVAEVAQSQSRYGGDGQVPVGVGLHVGDVAMGSVGCANRSTYTSVGQTVNVAARLCDRASGPEVLTTQTMRDAVADPSGMNFEAYADQAPPGVDDGLGLYRLRRR